MNDEQIARVTQSLLIFFEKNCQFRKQDKITPNNYTFFCYDWTNSSGGQVEAYVYIDADKKYHIQIKYESGCFEPASENNEEINCDNLIQVFQTLSDLHLPDPTTCGDLYFELLPPFKDRFERYAHYNEKKTLHEIYSTYYSDNFEGMLDIIEKF